VLFAVEAQRDRFQYHFANPSSFDTPAPVPHFFEQRYVADNIWAVVTIRYTGAGRVRFVAGHRLLADLVDFQAGHKTETRNGALVFAADVTSLETPQKYADDVVFSARVAGASARVTLARHHAWWPVELTLDGGRIWSYESGRAARRRAVRRPTRRRPRVVMW
jgi:hypothetical protein